MVLKLRNFKETFFFTFVDNNFAYVGSIFFAKLVLELL